MKEHVCGVVAKQSHRVDGVSVRFQTELLQTWKTLQVSQILREKNTFFNAQETYRETMNDNFPTLKEYILLPESSSFSNSNRLLRLLPKNMLNI